MTDPAAELKAAAAELAAGRGTGPHLTEDEIAAYHAGTLSADEEARAQDHLLACPVCTDLLLGREELAGEGEPVPPGEVAAAWEFLKPHLPVPEPQPRPAPLPFPTARRTAVPPWFGALAASLLVAVVGLFIHNLSLRRTIDDLTRPQADPPFVELSSGPLRGDNDEVQVLELAPGSQLFNLVLHPKNPTDSQTFGRYEVEIVRNSGAPVWKGPVRRNKFESFNLALSRRFMGEGKYRIRVWGEGEKGREVLGEYELRIVGNVNQH